MEFSVEVLYERYFPLLRAKCQRMLGDSAEAEDVAQETFVRFYRQRFQLSGVRAATSWLYRTSTRLAIDRMRQVRTKQRVDAQDMQDALMQRPRFEPELAASVRQLLAKVVDRIGTGELEVAVLCWVDGLRQEEVGEVLGIAERTVRRRLRRAEQQASSLRQEVMG